MAKSKAKAKDQEVEENEGAEEEVSSEPESNYSAPEENKPVAEFSIGDIQVSMNGADPFGMDGGESDDMINLSEYEEVDESNSKQKTRVAVNNGEEDPLAVNNSDREDFLIDAQASIDEEDRNWGE